MSLPRSVSLLACLFVATASSAAVVSAEIPVSAVVRGPAPGEQRSPAIATDGTDFLVVWTDMRTEKASLVAARVTAAGAVLDGDGIWIVTNSDARWISAPTVAWTGAMYVVFWSEAGLNGVSQLKLARIGSDGSLAAAPEVLAPSIQSHGRAVSNGQVTIVSYQWQGATSAERRHELAVLDREGHVIRTLHLAETGPWVIPAVLATNGDGFIAFWTAQAGSQVIEAARFDSDATRLDSTPLRIGLGYPLTAASDGKDYLLVARQWPESDMHVRQVSSAGSIGERKLLPIRFLANVAVRWTGSSYLFLWTFEVSPIRSIRLDASGSVHTPPQTFLDVEGFEGGTDLSVVGQSGFAVWSHMSVRYDTDVMGVAFAGDSPADERVIAESSTRQTSPSIASNGEGAFAIWTEQDEVIYGSRISNDGQYLDGRGIQFFSTLAAGRTPRAVFHGQSYLAAWVQYWRATGGPTFRTQIFTATIDPDGSVSSAADIDQCAAELSLASGAEHALLVWTDCQRKFVRAITLDQNGRVVGAAADLFSVAGTTNELRHPAVAWNGSRWLVVWSQYLDWVPNMMPPTGTHRRAKLEAMFVSSDGSSGDEDAITLAERSLTFHTDSAVASDGNDFFIAWQSVDADGASVEGALIRDRLVSVVPVALGEGRRPAVAWNGRRYTAAWAHGEDIVATTITADGNVDPRIFDLAATPFEERNVALAPAGDQIVIAAYERLAGGPLYGNVHRVFARTIFDLQRRRIATAR